MIQLERVWQLKTFITAWAATQMLTSPSTSKAEIIEALRQAANELERKNG